MYKFASSHFYQDIAELMLTPRTIDFKYYIDI